MSRNILRKLTLILFTILCQTHSQISRNAAVSSQNTEDPINLTDEEKRLQALQYTTTMFTPNRWAKCLRSRKQDFFFALKYSNDIIHLQAPRQLGPDHLRLGPPVPAAELAGPRGEHQPRAGVVQPATTLRLPPLGRRGHPRTALSVNTTYRVAGL